MRIAILGATSQIAKDLVLSFSAMSNHCLVLYARCPEVVMQWLTQVGLTNRYSVGDFSAFSSEEHFDVILNFVGVGNPAQAAAMGATIFDVTLQYDEMALNYARQRPDCRYIFLSSGAAYGSSFDTPADENTSAVIAINNLQPQDWYAVAKLHAECRHRSLADLPIVDIRVFNYFSHTQDMSARFFITDCLRAIRSSECLLVSPENIVRDYISPDDFYCLISSILGAPPANTALDCYTKGPVDKFTLLARLQENFGLSYGYRETPLIINATGVKNNYYSTNHRAEAFGYLPARDSLNNVLIEARLMLEDGITRPNVGKSGN
ncbi:MAG: NAD-dependent epimerase/dehydratase family protein [Azonexaceae bacterium]|nr:NAD-dependent epimerase/dehydratase family protein [Azonexaceae bacterium]